MAVKPHNLRHRHNETARHALRRAGYKVGGAVKSDEAEDRKTIAAAIHKHERHDHPGEPLTKLARGGPVNGDAPARRLDRKPRGKAKGKTQVNVIVAAPRSGGDAAAGGPDAPTAFKAGLLKGALAARQPMGAPGGPPPAGPAAPPPGPMPAGGPAGMPPKPMGPMRHGGRVRKATGGRLTEKMDAGAGSGVGRLAKADYYGKKGKR